MKKKKSKKTIEPAKPSIFTASPELRQMDQDTSNCADSAGALFNVSPLKRPEKPQDNDIEIQKIYHPNMFMDLIDEEMNSQKNSTQKQEMKIDVGIEDANPDMETLDMGPQDNSPVSFSPPPQRENIHQPKEERQLVNQ